MIEHVIINGGLANTADARVEALAAGVPHGAGLFETFRAIGGRAPLLRRHLARMRASADALGIPCPLDAGLVADCVEELSAATGLADARMRLTLLDAGGGKAEWLITAEAAPPEKTFRCALFEAAPPPLARHKTTNRPSNQTAHQRAREAGFDEAILHDADGRVLEGTFTNVFIVRSGELATPPLSLPILPGVARALVIEAARKAGISVLEEPFTTGELLQANEVFLTNALRGVIPVEKIGVKNFIPGRLTEDIRMGYNKQIETFTNRGF
jgi:branched-subunit amino acid aminotransferase/4-amino-4-deoxychorismate lyase